jgi:hypothetical protein
VSSLPATVTTDDVRFHADIVIDICHDVFETDTECSETVRGLDLTRI